MSPAPSSNARILVAAGVRETETLLLECLEPLVEAARSDWRLLAKPVRIVVPSRSLRDHVSATLVGRFGPALAGLEIQTLHGLALEILDRMHAPAAPGEALLPILVRVAAKREPLFVCELGGLHDGFGAVVGSVRDLLDAGHVRENADVIEEALASLPGATEERERAGALVRVTREVSARLEQLGLDSRASLLGRAADALRREPERALPQRAVLVHGFADATGVATDLVEALVRACGARVLLDRPPDPSDTGQPDSGCAFTERFAARLESAGELALLPHAQPPPPEIRLLRAPGGEAEVRGVSLRVRALLDERVPSESIGVVARTLTPYALRIRSHFDRLGIPFSTLRARSGPDGGGRRIEAFLALLERRGETPVDRWLDALAPGLRGTTSLADLRMALHALGAARVEQVAALDIPRRLQGKPAFALPVRHGITLEECEDGELRARGERRHVPREALCTLVSRAARLCEALLAWPDEAPLGEHLDRARDLVVRALGWMEEEPACAPLLGTLAQFVADLPASMRMDGQEFLLLLRGACDGLGSRPLGGAGAGVQVLDATEARARTFTHLFVLGMNRDLFPRVVLEDPLLPDSLRRGLLEHGTGVLPDLPLKLGGFAEERYLFAQLLTASPQVTLSWQSVDDDGKERAVSTFVERLWLAGRAPAAEALPTLWSPGPGMGPRPAAEHLVLAGLYGSRAAFGRLLPLALAEVAAESVATGRLDADAVAHARMAALDLLEPRGTAHDEIGPAFGFVGERHEGDSRGSGLAITTLEQIAGCPWQAFLTRVLHVEPGPDALGALPAVDALLLGSVLHASVEAIVRASLPEEEPSLEAALRRGAVPVPWPSDTDLRQIVAQNAERLLEAEGIASPGLVRVLANRAQPLLSEVFEHLWRPSQGRPAFFGTELTGAFRVRDDDDRLREITFRADLAQEVAGGPCLIDLKTGRPISEAKTEKTRRGHLLKSVARGRSLQALAYACAASGEGRYLYANPERSRGNPVCSVSHDDAELLGMFDEAVRTLLAAWDRGSFLPRLERPEGSEGKPPCDFCQVTEACARGDSGARRRLARWATAEPERSGPGAAALAAAWAVFRLPARQSKHDGAAGEEPT